MTLSKQLNVDRRDDLITYKNSRIENYKKEIEIFLKANPYWEKEFNNLNPFDSKSDKENFKYKSQVDEEGKRKFDSNRFISSIRIQKKSLDLSINQTDSAVSKLDTDSPNYYEKYKASLKNIELLKASLTEADIFKLYGKMYDALDFLYVSQQKANNSCRDSERPITHKNQKIILFHITLPLNANKLMNQ